MKRITKKITTVLLILTMVFTTVGTSFANVSSDNLIKLDNGNEITEQEVIEILNTYNSDISSNYTTVNIENNQDMLQPAALVLIPAWAVGQWVIPLIGTVIITPVAIYLGGLIVEAGSALFNSIISAVENIFNTNYKNAKKDGTPTDNHSVQTGSSLPTTGEPNSSKDLKDSNGSIKQRRYYDKNGDADMDIDYHHGGVGHTFPHRHDWNNGVRGPEY